MTIIASLSFNFREAEIRFEIEGRREEEEEEGSDELIIIKGKRRRRKLPGILRGWTSQKRHEIDEEEIEESEDSSSNNTDTNDDQQEEEEEEKATVTITESNDSKPEENVVTLNTEVSRRPAVFRAVQRHPDIQVDSRQRIFDCLSFTLISAGSPPTSYPRKRAGNHGGHI